MTHAHLGPIWYHKEPSEIPYSPNKFLCWDFFAVSYSKTALHKKWSKIAGFYIYKISKKKILCGNFYMAKIVQFYSFLIQVEIKKQC